jgi:hypothetical protein
MGLVWSDFTSGRCPHCPGRGSLPRGIRDAIGGGGAEGRAATLRTEHDGGRGEAGSADRAARQADRTVNPGLADGVVGFIQTRWRRHATRGRGIRGGVCVGV